MAQFFIPYIEDADRAEEYWQSIKAFAEQHDSRVSDARIAHLEYLHDGREMKATVGEPHPYGHPASWEYTPDYVPDYSDPRAGEYVVAIFECRQPGPFLVCTHNRGVVRGEPILVGAGEVRRVEYFEGFERALAGP